MVSWRGCSSCFHCLIFVFLLRQMTWQMNGQMDDVTNGGCELLMSVCGLSMCGCGLSMVWGWTMDDVIVERIMTVKKLSWIDFLSFWLKCEYNYEFFDNWIIIGLNWKWIITICCKSNVFKGIDGAMAGVYIWRSCAEWKKQWKSSSWKECAEQVGWKCILWLTSF